MRTGLKYLSACVAHAGQLLRLRRFLMSGSDLVILMYHRVLPDPNADDVFTQPGITVSTATFRRQVAWLKRWRHVITLAEVARLLESGNRIPPRSVVITFDDGWRDNADDAYTVLKEAGLPATIFVTTGFIDTGEEFWFHRIGRLLAQRNPDRSKVVSVLRDQGVVVREMIRSDDDLIESLKDLNRDQLNRVLGQLEKQFGPLDALSKPLTMSWEQLRALDPAIIEIGSHGVSHQILTTMSQSDAREELTKSKIEIEQKLGRPVTSFAYPNGNHSPELKQLVREAGYKVGIATRCTCCPTAFSDRYALKRLGMHDGATRAPWGRFSASLFHWHLEINRP